MTHDELICTSLNFSMQNEQLQKWIWQIPIFISRSHDLKIKFMSSVLSYLSSLHNRKYGPEFASCIHFNRHSLKCSVHHANFYEASSLLVFSTMDLTTGCAHLFDSFKNTGSSHRNDQILQIYFDEWIGSISLVSTPANFNLSFSKQSTENTQQNDAL